MDAFEVMGIARRLDLSPEELQERYDELCRERHPDVGGKEKAFQQLQESYEILRHPVPRLRHWLALQGEKPGMAMGDGMMKQFGSVGALLGRCDEVLKKKEDGQSTLVRSMAQTAAIDLLAELEEVLQDLGERREDLEGRFVEFDEMKGSDSLVEAVEVAGVLVFLEKWEGQLRDRWVRLGL